MAIKFKNLTTTTSGGVKLQLNDADGILSLLNENGDILSYVDLPTERIIKSISYDANTSELVFVFDNVPEVRVPIGDIFEIDNYYNKDEVDNLIGGKVDNSITVNGHELTTSITISKDDIELGNVRNVEGYSKTETNNLLDDKLIIDSTVATSKAVGGIPAGTILTGESVLSVLEKMLFPYVPFTINVSDVSPSGTYEKGDSVTITSVTVKLTMGSKDITTLTLYDSANNKLGEKTTGIGTTNTFVVNQPTTSAITFSATATDGESTLSDSTSFLSFYNPTFYGVFDVGYTLASDLITTKTKAIKSNKNNTFTYNALNQHPFVAYPASYGNLTSIVDSSNLEYIGDFTKTTMNLTVKSGSVSYNVYVLKEPTDIENFKFKFS